MSGVLESVDRRTQMVGQNRLELLLFRLNQPQLFGINVFKVREVLRCPPLNRLPAVHPFVRGYANIRGVTLPIMDLGLATGMGRLGDEQTCFTIVTEYSKSAQGFLVGSVDRIVNMRWEQIHAAPATLGSANYLTGVTDIDGSLVEILDVEKILQDIAPRSERISDEVLNESYTNLLTGKRVLVVDDSAVARKQIQKTVEALGIEMRQCGNGMEALEHLRELAADGVEVDHHYALLVSDIEMPEMDGYTLTTEIRRDPRLAKLKVMLHTSLSGVFNKTMVARVGADDFLPKFSANDLAQRLVKHLTSDTARPI